MIRINKHEFPWREGMTLNTAVSLALADERFYELSNIPVIYIVNGKVMDSFRIDSVILDDEDEIMVSPISDGG